MHSELAQGLGRGRRRAFRKGDADPGVGWTTIIVTDEEAADAAEAVADSQAGAAASMTVR